MSSWLDLSKMALAEESLGGSGLVPEVERLKQDLARDRLVAANGVVGGLVFVVNLASSTNPQPLANGIKSNLGHPFLI